MKVYGPYIRKDGRQHVVLYFGDQITKTVSYPKYLIEQHPGRKLKKDETVHHIDGNFLNNDLSNLEVLTRKEHSIKDVTRVKLVKVNCQTCGASFEINPTEANSRRKRGTAGPFCSKQCSGKYGSSVQYNKRQRLGPQAENKVEYYKAGVG